MTEPATRRIALDIVVICTATALLFAAIHLADADLHEFVTDFLGRYEDWELDELLVVGIFVMFGMMIFSLRRWQELRKEISEHKALEEALSGSERLLTNIIEQSPFSMWISDSQGTLLRINPACQKRTQLSEDEVVGKYNILADEAIEAQGLMPLVRSVFDNGETVNFEMVWESALLKHIEHNKSTKLILDVTMFPVKDLDGKVTNAVIQHIDISDRKRVDEALRESEQRYRTLVDNMSNAVAVYRAARHGEDFIFVDFNKAGENIENIKRQDIIHKSVLETFPGIREFGLFEVFQRVWNTGEPERCPVSFYKDDRIHGWRDNFVYRLPSGEVVSVYSDETERKQAEEALRENEEKFRTIFEGAGDGIFGVDPLTRKAVLVSPSMCNITGYTQSELLQLSVDDIHPKQDLPDVLDQFLKLRNREIGVAKDIPVVRKDGDLVYCDITVGFSRFGARDVFIGFFRDVTERRLAAQTIRESEERYRILFERTTDAIFIVHPGGEIIDANPACGKLFGGARDEIVGTNILQFFQNPSDRDRIRAEIGLKGFAKDFDWKVKHSTGGVKHCLLTSSAWKDEHGTVLAHFCIARDITHSKNLEKQLLQSQKMEAVGTLAGGIAHDFNNLLHVISGYTEMALFEIKEGDTGYSEFQEIKGAAESAAELTQSLLTFSRRVESKLRPVDLNGELQKVARMLSRTLQKTIEIKMHLSEPLDKVNADPAQLQQIVMNLAVNARDAMPDGGKLVIETRNVFLDEEYCRAHFETTPGKYVLLNISDNGAGMDERTRWHIFDPFFTTKDTGKGTGLGLSIAFGIVKNHGGTIGCYSEPGEGTTFKIYLPAFASDEDKKEAKRTGTLPGGSETILLVDDEESVRKLGETILKRFGYSVLIAENGKEGVEVFAKEKEDVDLVILDLIMPEMGGRDCLKEILKLAPGTRVIIASGYAANGHIDQALEEGATASVQKPYEAEQLLEIVRKVIDEE